MLITPKTLLTTISKVPKTEISLKQLQPATKIVAGDTKGIKVSILLTQQLIHSYEYGIGTDERNTFARNIKYTRSHLISPVLSREPFCSHWSQAITFLSEEGEGGVHRSSGSDSVHVSCHLLTQSSEQKNSYATH